MASVKQNDSKALDYPQTCLEKLAQENDLEITDEKFCRLLDEKDELSDFKTEFSIPTLSEILDGKIPDDMNGEDPCLYLCSNSLGLMVNKTHDIMTRELDKWSKKGVCGHLTGELPWAFVEELTRDKMAEIVGAKKEEVILMNSLTVNLHQGLVAFYRPTPTRYKILCEAKAFPSDHYAFESQIRFHGYNPKDALLCVEPKEGEETWKTEDILDVIAKEGESIALILFSGVHYFSGQLFDMKAITEAGHKEGCYVGFDLAHAVGNVPLQMHDWDVDVACWCTYKYLSGGAGSVGGFFVHEKHANNFDIPRMIGWWAHKMDTRFEMTNNLDLVPGAGGFQMSNASPFSAAGVIASLEVFTKATMSKIREKSLLLTAYLEMLIDICFGKPDEDEPKTKRRKEENDNVYVEIITPRNPRARGSQLSLRFPFPVQGVHREFKKMGIIVDTREPNIMRVAPFPLVNSYYDVFKFIELLKKTLTKLYSIN